MVKFRVMEAVDCGITSIIAVPHARVESTSPPAEIPFTGWNPLRGSLLCLVCFGSPGIDISSNQRGSWGYTREPIIPSCLDTYCSSPVQSYPAY